MKNIKNIIIVVFIGFLSILFYNIVLKYKHENAVLKKMIARLDADSRVAEVLVTGVNYDEQKGKSFTTIKFLEYDAKGKALEPKYFTFSGNIIQFQSLVMRFDNIQMRSANHFKGKSAFIFWKVFMLDGENTQEYVITEVNKVPSGYKVDGIGDLYEQKLWRSFWDYVTDPEKADKEGIKNVQIEAPGTMFIPGILYTVKIEHDGGLRIDSSRLSPILKGEAILE